jgi:hypothetical protein
MAASGNISENSKSENISGEGNGSAILSKASNLKAAAGIKRRNNGSSA